MLMVSARYGRRRRLAWRRKELLCRSEENNKALVRRFFEEVVEQRERGRSLDELLAPDFVVHDALPEGSRRHRGRTRER